MEDQIGWARSHPPRSLAHSPSLCFVVMWCNPSWGVDCAYRDDCLLSWEIYYATFTTNFASITRVAESKSVNSRDSKSTTTAQTTITLYKWGEPTVATPKERTQMQLRTASVRYICALQVFGSQVQGVKICKFIYDLWFKFRWSFKLYNALRFIT